MLVRMLLRGGISTSKTVTDVSGRGIGLDVVREAVERLGGEVVFRTDAGVGTTFELVIPPSLASMEALIVEAGEGGSAAAIPLDCGAQHAARRRRRHFAAADRRLDPVRAEGNRLHSLVDRPGRRALGGRPELDGHRGGGSRRAWRRSGSIVCWARRELSCARCRERLTASPIVAGASLDAEGNPQLVLDPDGLVAAAHRGDAGGEIDATAPRHPVLVVDDSLTTRMLEQSILELAGYEVDVALSGEEALELVRRKRYALILVDVEMPGMDGFTFIERMRADPALRDIPAILVTSRAAPEDLQRGRDVGAQGYIVKSEFDQAELLAMIKPLMG